MPASMDLLDVGSNYADLLASVQAAYTRRAATYDESKFHQDLAFDFANDFLAGSDDKPFLHASSHVLDLCCGTGLVTHQFVSKMMSDTSSLEGKGRGRVVGVDMTKALIDQARLKASALEQEMPKGQLPVMEFYEADVTRLIEQVPQLEKGSFDLVSICSAVVLLNFESIPQAMADWTSYLRPGGKLLFDIPGPGSQPFAHGKAMASIFGERDMNDATARCWSKGEPGRKAWTKISSEWINNGNSPAVIEGAVQVTNELLAYGSPSSMTAPVLRIEKLFLTDKVYDRRVRKTTSEYLEFIWKFLSEGPSHFHTEAVNAQLLDPEERKKMKARVQQAILNLAQEQGEESEGYVDEFRFFICLVERVG